jgi:hypothetical protein
MKRAIVLLAAAAVLLLLPPSASAQLFQGTGVIRCGWGHFVRNGRIDSLPNAQELRLSAIFFDNGDPENSATIQRITIRDFFGNVVHDSGPDIGVPHPLNTDFSPPVDITVVPPLAAHYLVSTHIWGNNNVPDLASTNPSGREGFSLSITVHVTKPGRSALFAVRGRVLTRQRLPAAAGGFFLGAETASNILGCFQISPR